MEDVVIGAEVIKRLRRAKALDSILRWLNACPRTYGELIREEITYARWIAFNVELPQDVADWLYEHGCPRTWWREGRRHRESAAAVIAKNGLQEWWIDGRRHRVNGPAAVYPEGTMEWWYWGRRHRMNGPAVICPGYCAWFEHGRLHRADGPAIIWMNGAQAYCREGRLHRDDGPAVVRADGTVEYWRDGERVPEPTGISREVSV